jgi:hypothetical protein
MKTSFHRFQLLISFAIISFVPLITAARAQSQIQITNDPPSYGPAQLSLLGRNLVKQVVPVP